MGRSEKSAGILARAEKAHREREYGTAATLFEIYLQDEPDNLSARSQRAFCLLNTSQPGEALKEAHRTYAQAPDTPIAAFTLLEALAGNDCTDELAQYAELFSKEPLRLPMAWLHKGKLTFFDEDYEEAVRCLSKATEALPELCIAWLVLGESLLRLS